MEKPTEGKWRCLACGLVWDAREVMLDPHDLGGRLCCGDAFCGGTVVRVKEETKKEN